MSVPDIEIVDVTTVDAPSPEFASFFRDEYPGLVALATAVLGDRQAGEDVAAEAMTRAYRRWDRIGRYDRPGAWTRRVTVNLLHSRRRKAASEVKAILRLRGRRTVDADRPDRDVVADDAFQRMLTTLAPRQRTAAALHYLDDLAVDDIAELMDCTPGTVKSHLHAARAAVAAILEEDDR